MVQGIFCIPKSASPPFGDPVDKNSTQAKAGATHVGESASVGELMSSSARGSGSVGGRDRSAWGAGSASGSVVTVDDVDDDVVDGVADDVRDDVDDDGSGCGSRRSASASVGGGSRRSGSVSVGGGSLRAGR